MAQKSTYEELKQNIKDLKKESRKHKRDEEKIMHLNLVLRTIRNVNQLLVKEKDRSRLLQGICNNLIENRSYYNAWIVALDSSGDLVATAEAGLGKRFKQILRRIEKGELTHCAQQALKQSKVVVTKDPFSTCTDCPLSTKYTGRGGMTVRLEHGGKVSGLLVVSTPREFIANKEEQDLLEEVAGDIAFGLRTIELEEERKQAEEAVRESERRIRDLIENSLTGISIVQDNQIIYQNPEQERLLGPLPRPFILADLDGIHPDDMEKVKRFYQRINSGEIQTLDTDFRFYPVDKAGNRRDMRWVYCRTSLIEYQGKEGILVNMSDITSVKELEDVLRIQDKMSSLGRVTAGIAHEIRNPLSGINVYLNTLEKIYDREDSLGKVKQILGQLQSASNKIESIIRRVMDFSKPSAPKFILADINKPIEEAITLSAVTLRKSGIKIKKDLYEDLPPCHADPTLIEQVILNLITNASEAMRNMDNEKKIEVTSSVETDCIHVKVSDSGPGVSPNIQDKIFDPFYTTKSDSTGIGLSLCHRVISDHAGSLMVSSSKWGGAQFVIEIPVEKEKV